MGNTKRKITFCTVCMNRLHHLEHTLPKNIIDNIAYGNIEFLILDYNSQDGLLDWMKKFKSEHLFWSQNITYFKTNAPKYFHRSHSRNMAFKLANGDIICNVDADNYTGERFADYINDMMNEEEIFLSPIPKFTNADYEPCLSDAYGRICITKNAFNVIRGFDERMSTHGFEDHDLVNRLELKGYKRKLIDNPIFLNAIRHSDAERIINERAQLDSIIVKHISASNSEVIFLYQNGDYQQGIIIDNLAKCSADINYIQELTSATHTYSLTGKSWAKGSWHRDGDNIYLKNSHLGSFTHQQIFVCQYDKAGTSYFFELTNEKIREQLILFNHQIENRHLMEENYNQKKIIVNEMGYGMGIVY